MSIMPGANWRPVPNHSGPMSAHHGLVLHVQVGNNSPYGEFCDPNSQASSTWWVSKSGTVEQYVDSDVMAWTQAAGNGTWNGVETEGFPNEPLTDAQMGGLASIYAWGHTTYGWPLVLTDDPNGTGFGWHGMGGVAWGNHPSCPGDIRKGQRQQILNLVGIPPQPPSREENDTVTSLISGGQLHVWGVVNNVAYHWWQTIGGAGGWQVEKLATP
jgi:N-acetylmuramoyl-L-alanine amidase